MMKVITIYQLELIIREVAVPESNAKVTSKENIPNRVNQLDVAELIVRYLESIGVQYIFGIPGGAIEPIYNALAKSSRRGGLRPVNSCHETGAAYMADGYYRETRKLGVCMATSGPGGTNLITGVACAYDNNIPMLVLTGQPAIPSFGRSALQESSDTGVNIVGMLDHCTHYNSLVSHPDQVSHKLASAILSAFEARGPVHLSIPVDILRQQTSSSTEVFDLASKLNKQHSMFDKEATNELTLLLNQSQQPIFFIGCGAEEAIDKIMLLVELTGALFVTTPDAKGLINSLHCSYRGVFGFGGHQSATDCLKTNTGITVAFGASFDELSSNGWSKYLLNDSLIHVDEVPNHFLSSPMAKLHVRGHITTICHHLTQRLMHRSFIPSKTQKNALASGNFNPFVRFDELEKYYSDATPIKPQRLMKELSERFPPNTRFLADTGNSILWAPHYLQAQNRRGNYNRDPSRDKNERRAKSTSWLRLLLKFAPMGWAIGAAIGVSRGSPNSTTVCITGDGAYLMCGQEVTIAIQEKLPVIFVILNDSAYGMVMHGQRLAKAEPIGFELQKIDFTKQAESMGIPGFIIESPEDFNNINFETLLAREGPAIIDVRIDKTEVPPMLTRLKTLGSIPEDDS
jgi:acetolactate synthase-1/2/3 large subunit